MSYSAAIPVTKRALWIRLLPVLTLLVAGLEASIVQAACQAAPLSAAAAATSSVVHQSLHAQLWTGFSEIAVLVEPHGRQGCAGMGHIAFLGVIALVVIAALRFRYAASAARIDLARRMVERGMTPPAEIFSSDSRNDLRRGLVLLGAGAGLLLFGYSSNPDAPSVAGLIPTFIGIGYLLSHRLARGS